MSTVDIILCFKEHCFAAEIYYVFIFITIKNCSFKESHNPRNFQNLVESFFRPYIKIIVNNLGAFKQ